MLKIKLLVALLTAGFINTCCQSQTNDSIPVLAESLKKLIALNSFNEGSIDFSGQEAINLETNATAAQLIEITAPYFNSETINAKKICIFLLSNALFKKAKSQEQRQEIVEIFCKNYLTTDTEVQFIDNILLQLKEKDFNRNARKYIAALIDAVPKFTYSICAQLSAIAQIKESIPALWKIANKNIATMQHGDLDVLASLARMSEKEAGVLLCNYYNGIKNKTDYKHVQFAKCLAFSSDRTVLNCLVADFKSIYLNINFRGNDYFFSPSYHLGRYIAAMLKNYPYPKNYSIKPKQLSDWLDEACEYVLDDK